MSSNFLVGISIIKVCVEHSFLNKLCPSPSMLVNRRIHISKMQWVQATILSLYLALGELKILLKIYYQRIKKISKIKGLDNCKWRNSACMVFSQLFKKVYKIVSCNNTWDTTCNIQNMTVRAWFYDLYVL